MDRLLNELNKEQRAAVVYTQGPQIVLAGAGSGKTRVLISKVLYLIEEKGIAPQNILMVTFTNKAAGEMKERITARMQTRFSSLPTVGTFHSLCARILRKEGRVVGLSHSFNIYDTEDQLQTIKDAFNLLSLTSKDIKPRSALSAISQAKNQMLTPQKYASFARGYFQEHIAKIYPVYQNLLKERDACDFDDLLLETVNVFKKDKTVLESYQELFRYILIDEYQDTNHAQYELTRLLGEKHKNVCIVGDFSQSIYSFRGADFRNLEKFKRDFKDAKTFPLSQNYRSTQNILNAAYSVISHNNTHPILSLWTENDTGEDIEIFNAENEHNEVEYIIEKINEKKLSDPFFSYSDVAILYRMNAQSRAIEEVLLHHAIPYTLVGGVKFYERREVKDVLSYLSFLVSQKNAVAQKRIEKLGKRRYALFLEYLEEFKRENYLEKKTTAQIMEEVLQKTSYLELYDPKDGEDQSRLENIAELRSVAIEFPDIVAFLENVALIEQEYTPLGKIKGMRDENQDKAHIEAVTLMTMHAAKGLEFKMVFLVGMEEGLFPHNQAFFDPQELEEERRLCYVGITRAKQKLTFTFAQRRLFFGQRLTPTPSRFLFELPNEIVEKNLSNSSIDPDFL